MSNRKHHSPEIVLYYPEYDRKVTQSNLLEIPLPILHVAKALLQAGYDVKIEDGRIPGAHERLQRLKSAPLFFGISTFLGQIDDGCRAAQGVRARFPQVPVVCGGWLPTMSPELFQDNESISILVRGPAEVTAPMLARNLAANEEISDIPGVLPTSTLNGNPIAPSFGPSRPPGLDFPFHLLDVDRYEIAGGRVDLLTSRGCPSRCTFCAMASVYKGEWFARSAEEIVNAVVDLKARYNLKRFQFYDDSFFTDRERVLGMAEGFLSRDLSIKWLSTGRMEDLSTFSGDHWKRIAQSGCSIVSCGVESGVARIRRILGKNFSNEAIYATAERLKNAGIRFAPFFLIDPPDETVDDLEATFDMVTKLAYADPESYPHIAVYIYFPMPSTPLFRIERSKGYLKRFPRNLDRFCRIPPDSHWGHAPWIPRSPIFKGYRDRKRALIRSFYFWANRLCPALVMQKQNVPAELIRRGVQALIQRRIKARFFSFPVEWHAYRAGWAMKRWFKNITPSDTWSRVRVTDSPHEKF